MAPGPRDPLKRWGTPAEIAFLAVSLVSEEAGYVTSQCVLADGGKYFLWRLRADFVERARAEHVA